MTTISPPPPPKAHQIDAMIVILNKHRLASLKGRKMRLLIKAAATAVVLLSPVEEEEEVDYIAD